MKTKFEQIIDVSKIGKRNSVDLGALSLLAADEKIAHIHLDKIKRLLLCIDIQNDFVEGGALPVQGSIGDVERLLRFIYKNMYAISNITCSLDVHNIHQIFHQAYWVDENGNQPKPYTIISYKDVLERKWLPAGTPIYDAQKYLKSLEENDKKQLCIWPYHCIIGTEGAALESELAKMIYFHSIVRRANVTFIPKGTNPNSEMYGILHDEYNTNGHNVVQLFETSNNVKMYDEIYIAGEAASHCVLESIKQIAMEFEKQGNTRTKIIVLEDCTSPIPGYEEETKKAFEELHEKHGVIFRKSTDIIL